MLSDIIRDIIGSQPDMEVVGEVRHRGGVQSAVGDVAVDIVILGLLDSDLPSDCVALLETYPWIRMLGVSADGRSTFRYELRPHRSALADVSPQGLIEAIRTAARREVT